MKNISHIENEKEIEIKNEQNLNELIQKEKELRVQTLEKEREEKKIQMNLKDLQRQEENDAKKQIYENLYKDLQTTKDNIFRLGAFTGFNKDQIEINQSVSVFKFLESIYFIFNGFKLEILVRTYFMKRIL